VGANYRGACRARSQADFISKIGIVEEECDESIYWIELLVDSDQIKSVLVEDLLREANEILSMIVASRKTALARKSSNRQ
jgi:four helix bundle protein